MYAVGRAKRAWFGGALGGVMLGFAVMKWTTGMNEGFPVWINFWGAVILLVISWPMWDRKTP
jgi:hypothetical protein